MSAPNLRRLCILILEKWRNGRAHLDQVTADVVAGTRIEGKDRALIDELCIGQIRNFTLLDFWIAMLRDKPVDFQTRDLLRLGLYQIFFTRIPVHAAVFETVAIAGRAKGIVNALLRRAAREREELLAKSVTQPSAVRFSHPESLVAQWTHDFGAEAAAAICEWNNHPPELYARVLPHRMSVEDFVLSFPDCEAVVGHPLMVRCKRLPREALAEGLCYIQDPSTLAACELLNPKSAMLILDACAAPGGKTIYLAGLADMRSRVVATDVSHDRLVVVGQNVALTKTKTIETRIVDWETAEHPVFEDTFDRILVDAPCSNTGVMRRRADVRWRIVERDIVVMTKRQLTILSAVARYLEIGGLLVYSTCSIDPRENRGVVDRFLAAHPSFRLVKETASRPDIDQIDGAYAALIERLG